MGKSPLCSETDCTQINRLGAEGPKAVSPPGDPSVAKTSSGLVPLGSPVPPPGPVPDIMTPAIPASGVELPIDLPTALRLAERENPVIGEARARIGEALGRQQKALVELVPMLKRSSRFLRVLGVCPSIRFCAT